MEYLDAMRFAWQQVDILHKSGTYSAAWLVQRARVLYRTAWRQEVRRSRGVG